MNSVYVTTKPKGPHELIPYRLFTLTSSLQVNKPFLHNVRHHIERKWPLPFLRYNDSSPKKKGAFRKYFDSSLR